RCPPRSSFPPHDPHVLEPGEPLEEIAPELRVVLHRPKQGVAPGAPAREPRGPETDRHRHPERQPDHPPPPSASEWSASPSSSAPSSSSPAKCASSCISTSTSSVSVNGRILPVKIAIVPPGV